MNTNKMSTPNINNNIDIDDKNLNNGELDKKKNSEIIKNNNNIVGTQNADPSNTNADPEGKKLEECICICQRPRDTFECLRCHWYFYGRVYQTCQKHPLYLFLMDFRYCPHCSESTTNCKVSQLSLETIQQMQNAPLPDDNDL